MSINSYHAATLKRLLSASTKVKQLQIAASISYITCIEIGVEAYPDADYVTREEIAELLNHLYHALERDSDSAPRYHWPAIVEENYALFHRRNLGEVAGAAADWIFHFLYSIPVLGFIIILVWAGCTICVIAMIYFLTLPFPKIHGEITRRMNALATVAENAQ